MSSAKGKFQPDYAVPPGWILQEILESKDMSQVELARRCGRSAKLISEIISGYAPIEPETALQFEKVLGMHASIWLNIEAAYQLHDARLKEAKLLDKAKSWCRNFPISEMAKRNLIQKPQSEADKARFLLAFFGVASVDAWQEKYNSQMVAYRHSPSFKSSNEALTVWLRQGELIAQEQECSNYNANKFKNALKSIRNLTAHSPDKFIPEMREACNDSGVAFVIIQSMPKTALSGAARWLSPRKALIQQSVRHLSNDHFWFTFFHEAAHIILHNKKLIFVDEKGIDGTEFEEEANSWAKNFLVNKSDWSAFVSEEKFTSVNVKSFAKEQGIAPGIVVGMLQHDGLLNWSQLNGLKQRYKWVEQGT